MYLYQQNLYTQSHSSVQFANQRCTTILSVVDCSENPLVTHFCRWEMIYFLFYLQRKERYLGSLKISFCVKVPYLNYNFNKQKYNSIDIKILLNESVKHRKSGRNNCFWRLVSQQKEQSDFRIGIIFF